MIKINKVKDSAFTIVELLIVIVIIGILAAITIVSYTGITKKAGEASLKADLANASKKIKLYNADHGFFPDHFDNNNCPVDSSGNVDNNYCIKTSANNVITYFATSPYNDYDLTIDNGTVTYTSDSGSEPVAVNPSASFAKVWGGTGGDFSDSVVKTSDGGFAIAGVTPSFGAGASDIFITKYNSAGEISWNRTWGGTGNDSSGTSSLCDSLIQTSDGGFAVAGSTYSFGATSGDAFVAKFTSTGNLSWSRVWGGSGAYETANALVQASDGSVAVTGHTCSFGSGACDAFVVKYDSNGTFSWNKTWGGAASIDIGSNIIATSDGGFAMTGYTGSYGAGVGDLILVKYDSAGNVTWNRTWGGSNNERGVGLVQTSDNGYVMSGETQTYGTATDAFLVKFDSSGNFSWNKTWGGSSNDQARDLIRTSDNGFAMIGYTGSFGAGSTDLFLAKYDSAGTLSWNKTWGGTSNDQVEGIVQASDGSYITTGYTSSYGVSGDAFLTKFKPDGSMNNCISPMCQTPSATVTTPSATVTTPTATVSTPSATTSSPTATVTNAAGTLTTIVAP